MERQLAVTAIGPDRAGLIRDLSKMVTDAAGNILESRMIALGSEFAILMLVAGNWHIEAGTNGLVIAGTTGESACCSKASPSGIHRYRNHLPQVTD